ncbi:MAG: hypothetical protein ACOYNI_12135 [Acidimicrobiia bacterium]
MTMTNDLEPAAVMLERHGVAATLNSALRAVQTWRSAPNLGFGQHAREHAVAVFDLLGEIPNVREKLGAGLAVLGDWAKGNAFEATELVGALRHIGLTETLPRGGADALEPKAGAQTDASRAFLAARLVEAVGQGSDEAVRTVEVLHRANLERGGGRALGG